MNKFRIKPGMDKLKAFIELVDESDFGFDSYASLMAQLKEMGIVAGIMDSVIKKAFEQDPSELLKPVVVAMGKKPGEPKDARFDFKVEITAEPQFIPDEEETHIDYKESMKIQLVDAGEYLGEYFPAQAGSAGFNIYGNEIPGLMGESMTVIEGEGVRKEGNKFYATKTGKPSFNLGTIEVRELLEIEGDISYETGNVDFPGSVLVKGAILDGFKVISGGDLEVYGVIGNCELQIGGMLKANGGIIAKSEHLIKANGGMEIAFANNAKLESKNDICITKNILHSQVHSLGRVRVQKGSIIGGKVIAAKGVEAVEIGSETGVATEVFIRINYEAVLLQEILDKLLQAVDLIYQKNRGYISSGTLPEKAFPGAIEDLKEIEGYVQKAVKIEEQILAREKLVQDLEGVCIRTHKRVWPDVVFRAPRCVYNVQGNIDGAKVFIDSEELSTLVVHNG